MTEEYAWVTKFALSTARIRKIRVERRDGSEMLVRDADDSSRQWFVVGAEAFFSFNEALADARQRRDRKIKILQSQIYRLHRLKFEEPK